MAGSVDRHEYQVAIICALETECNAVEGIFDELYETNNILWQKSDGDRISYTLGRVGRHHVVLAYMPGTGKVNAATTASSLRSTFPNVATGLTLVVGVCGGAPRTSAEQDIYLGDVVISTGVIQADFGRELADTFVAKDHLEGNLGAATVEIKSFLSRIKTRTTLSALITKTATYSAKLVVDADISLPDPSTDMLFPATYLHKHQDSGSITCQTCSKGDLEVCSTSQNATCIKLGCHEQNTRSRSDVRSITTPSLYFGLVCSTDAVRRNGLRRDELISSYNVLAFEMEGAGIWETLPCLVVKAVCDYADSHKNKNWQELAAINAAASSKAILEEWMPMSKASSAGLRERNRRTVQEEPQDNSKAYLDSLDFVQLDSRFHNISFAHPGTCDWLFDTTEFKSWLDVDQLDHHHGVLWLRGKPGSGKSVLMKHIVQAKHFFEDRVLAAYFFHARGTELQHSITGLYRSLLFQLLSSDTTLLKSFVKAFPMRAGRQVSDHIWSPAELQHFLLLATRQGWIKRTILFIDALDECDHSDARELVSFCEDLALNAVNGEAPLLVCLSIRHFPNITMQKSVQVNVDSHSAHQRDIEEYVYQKSRVSAIAPQIVARSRHVFLWAVLVVRMMNDAHDRGHDGTSLLKILATIPTGLDAIFRSIMQDDQNTSEDPTSMFEFVFCAFQELSVEELWLMTTALDQKESHPLFDGSVSSDETMWNSVLTTSRGLLERTGFKSNSTVQFIHESVRDYLGSTTGTGIFSNDTTISSVADCHGRIADRCIFVLTEALRSGYIGTVVANYSSLRFSKSNALNYPMKWILQHIAAVQDFDKVVSLLARYESWLREVGSEESYLQHIVEHWNQAKSGTLLGFLDATRPLLPATMEAGVFVLDVALVCFESLVPELSRYEVLTSALKIVENGPMCDMLATFATEHGVQFNPWADHSQHDCKVWKKIS